MIHLILFLIAIGILLWLANTYVPMDGMIKKILNAVVIIGVVLYVLNFFGVLDGMSFHERYRGALAFAQKMFA